MRAAAQQHNGSCFAVSVIFAVYCKDPLFAVVFWAFAGHHIVDQSLHAACALCGGTGPVSLLAFSSKSTPPAFKSRLPSSESQLHHSHEQHSVRDPQQWRPDAAVRIPPVPNSAPAIDEVLSSRIIDMLTRESHLSVGNHRLGLGTYLASGGDVRNGVKAALHAGIRAIDTASLYRVSCIPMSCRFLCSTWKEQSCPFLPAGHD